MELKERLLKMISKRNRIPLHVLFRCCTVTTQRKCFRCVCSEEAYHDRTTEVYPFTVPPLVFSSLKLLNQVVLHWKLSLVYKDDHSS
ncbi:hypothetical protein POPTR_007G061540v4 [Populus trichocarpa]|uniref:Uncharacterized protein n=1 Tax=Populus trichocarpa TaxID=3694 RepID=A0ACC0SPN0_POPTR|nr:hypothetical protein BDE02_07G054800 [Populus trichocarpa]KAI9391206.1 hypothetical protein POPTR_007G061540v4 [Populus trichocarpa]